ncbi:MAG: hypothetical protein NTY35_00985 [Planctomycetota bacterium]|nr:hypothetical protein [Planctomycetota bacterium]
MPALLALAGCAVDGTERNLAPLWSEHSMAGGGVEVEALGGAIRTRTPRRGAAFSQVAARPLMIRDRSREEVVDHFLTPFGYATYRQEETVWQLLPITRYDRRTAEDGTIEWTLLTLPGIYWSKRADGRTLRGWFPFAGVMEQFLSYDRLEWVLFPLWMRTDRAGRITNHFLWPIFSWTNGTGGPSWRVWPLVGNSIYEGKYERWFLLWPFFLWQRNNLQLPPAAHETMWMVFPFYGRATAGDYSSNTVLWPFFGWASNESNGYYAVDAPWPLVRILRDPEQAQERTRAWPVYSEYSGDGLESTWWGWPFLNDRREVYEDAEKNATNIVPFIQNWERRDAQGNVEAYSKVWPFFQLERRNDDELHTAFPALNPLWRTPDIDAMYAWIWELYTRDRKAGTVRERTWLGLYRREKDELEDRRSLSALWSTRAYTLPEGDCRETSILFGLLRWRSGPGSDFGLMLPAFPGPGWPMERGAAEPAAAVDPGARPATVQVDMP